MSQDKHTHPYLKEKFYTLLDFWESAKYTDLAKSRYRKLQAAEQRELDRKAKPNCIGYKLGAKNV